jgi:hypothetical protein
MQTYLLWLNRRSYLYIFSNIFIMLKANVWMHYLLKGRKLFTKDYHVKYWFLGRLTQGLYDLFSSRLHCRLSFSINFYILIFYSETNGPVRNVRMFIGCMVLYKAWRVFFGSEILKEAQRIISFSTNFENSLCMHLIQFFLCSLQAYLVWILKNPPQTVLIFWWAKQAQVSL